MNFPNLPRIFKDVCELSTLSAWDSIAEESIEVPDFNVLIAGFSCKNKSSENNNRSWGPSGFGSRKRYFIPSLVPLSFYPPPFPCLTSLLDHYMRCKPPFLSGSSMFFSAAGVTAAPASQVHTMFSAVIHTTSGNAPTTGSHYVLGRTYIPPPGTPPRQGVGASGLFARICSAEEPTVSFDLKLSGSGPACT